MKRRGPIDRLEQRTREAQARDGPTESESAVGPDAALGYGDQPEPSHVELVETSSDALPLIPPTERDKAGNVIPGTTYRGRLVRVERFEARGREVVGGKKKKQRRLACYFAITSGRHSGVELPFYLNLPRSGRVYSGSKLLDAWSAATGTRAPADLAERDPASYLGGKDFALVVETVTLDWDKRERPEDQHWSKVASIARLEPSEEQ